MVWLVTAVPFLIGIALILLPGLFVTSALRLRGIDAIAIAPSVSIALITVSAMIAPLIGLPWNVGVPLGFSLLVAFILGVIYALIRYLRCEDFPATVRSKRALTITKGAGITAPALTLQRWFSKEQAIYWGSFLIGALLLLRNTKNAIGRPEWISQTFDNNFHLNAIRYIEQTQNGSSLSIAGMTSGDGDVFFYPAAWHDVVSLIFQLSGTTIPIATNTMALVTCAIIWPLNLVMLMRSIYRFNAAAVMSIGALGAAFTAYPVLLLNFGVLYPNLLGIALIPSGLALIIQLLRITGMRSLNTAQSLLLGIFCALGIALSHPNAIMSLFVIALPLVLVRMVLQIIRLSKGALSRWVFCVQMASLSAVLAVVNILWGIVRPSKEAGEIWGPHISQAQGYGEALTNAEINNVPQWFITIIFLIGIYALLRRKDRNLWLLLSWSFVAFFYSAARSLPWDQDRYWVVGIWYHDSYRLAALLPIVVIPIAVWGIQYMTQNFYQSVLWSKLIHVLENTIKNTSRRKQTLESQARIVSTAVVLCAVIYGGQTAQALTRQIEDSFWFYAPTHDSRLLTTDEIEILKTLDDYVPADNEIIVQPYTGSALAYALADRKVTAYHTIYVEEPEVKYVQEHLNQAKDDPKVCRIIKKDRMNYYLDFGKQEVNGDDHTHRYQGFENLKNSGILSEVHRQGDAILYRITACN
ncbi:DUF6541 family protein [Rothia sp. P7181]|uniref:DUF6541 family protein n=1 Tax=Rothia sp. P7181 TaxID=3402663 RepID=UPI003AEBAC83